ncbi:SusC/RagA family TonB-linked outer membrane protein [Flavobacterium sp. T12S277]|uniref:SusC/RagA family TonB-linked outer membrane protein n=1 Tax=Flavobacterium sp. T12S277 TaxID=3402752 RepID=UPI003ADB8349
MKLKLNGFLVLFLTLVSQITFAQGRSVSGTVSDKAGLPLPGVSVLVKGTKVGTQTDFEGKFTIKAAAADVLLFSFVGMKPQEVAASSSSLRVKLLEDSMQLENVVVTTALGIKREKKSLGYSTQEITGSDLSAGAGSANFLNELSGKAAGVSIRKNTNFGGSTNVVSRGIKSLTGDNQMLIVIDGMPVNNSNINSNLGDQTKGVRNTYDYGNAGMDINPDDIETLNILKGAAASALYGWQAGNGVIMITTKKGKSKKGLGVTITSELTIGTIDKSTFPDIQTKYGQGYGPTYDEKGKPIGIPTGPTGAFFTIDKNGNQVATTIDDASYGVAFDPKLSVFQWDAYTPFSDNYGKKTPWQAAKNGPITFFRTAQISNNSISLEDANDKTNFVLNLNHYKENGILPNSELKKNNLSLKFNHKFSDKLSTSIFANYSSQNTLGRNATGYGGNNVMGQFRQWWATNVDIKEQKEVFERSGGQNISWNMADPANGKFNPKYWDNPYFSRYKNYQTDERNRFIGYVQFDYKISDWLSASGKVSTDSYAELREERLAAGSLNAVFGINRLAVPSGYQKYQGMFSEQNYQFTLNFKKDITADLSLTGLLGTNALRTRRTSTLGSTEGGLIVPGLYALSNSVSPSPFALEKEDNSGVDSGYASLSFGFRDFLFLDGTFRYDAFSTLPKGDNSVNTFSASTSYVFTKHINQPWLSFGKLRASYAENPQGNIDLYALQDVFTKFNPFGDGQQLYSIPNVANNPELRPVKTASQEIGLEMQFFTRRIGFEVSAYRSLSSDQIYDVDYSTSTGYSKKYINSGSVENKGLEVQFNATPVKTEDFQWDVFVNWSKNKNEVVSLRSGIETITLGTFQGNASIIAKVGQPYGTIIGKDYTYTPDGQRITSNGSYVLSTTSTNVIGNVTPDWIGGLRNKFTYKQISVGFLIDMQKGGDLFSLDQSYGQDAGLYKSTAGNNELGNPVRNTIANGGGVILPGIDKTTGLPNTIRTPNPEASGSIYGYSSNPQKAFVYDASYIKLREVNITYRFPIEIISKMGLNDLRLSLVGSNLWIIHKNLPDADPESGLSSGNLAAGYSNGSLPTTRNIGCNLTLKF